jgi:homocysteine S-methyltransferase
MDLRETLQRRVLVCDGAMGTMLHAAGNTLDQSLPALNLTNGDLVRRIHDSYLEAGVDVIQTNTFGATRLRLAEYGHEDRVKEINQAGVRLARQAAASVGREQPVLVAGSVAPAGSVQQRRQLTAAQRMAALREQIDLLVDAGVDLLLLETFGYLHELVEAVEIATDGSGVPVIAQATFQTDTHTLSGHTPAELAAALGGAELAALGINCTLGPQGSLTVLRELRGHVSLPLTAQPNAGLPRRIAPARFEYEIDSEYFVRYVRQLLNAGARMVGGCCGTTPVQLAATVQAAREYEERLGPPTVTLARGPAPTGVTSATVIAGRERIVVELNPTTTGGVQETVDAAKQLHDYGIRLISVAAPRGPRAQVNSVDLALHLQQRLGVQTLASVTTWDRTIMALQADLLGAHALGIRRIVCETGNPPLLGDYPHTDGIWDVDSLGLIELLAGLNAGEDYHGLRLPAKTEFEIGARINPSARDLEREAARAVRKITAGARFLITRPLYERAGLAELTELMGGRQTPILAAIQPLKSFDEAELLANEVPDVRIPRAALAAMGSSGQHAVRVGMELAAELVEEISPLADGIVLAPTTDPIETLRAVLGR